MTLTTSFTKLRLPAQVIGYGSPPIGPERLDRRETRIATYPSAALVVRSSILGISWPSLRVEKDEGSWEEGGRDRGGAGSFGPRGMGRGTPNIV